MTSHSMIRVFVAALTALILFACPASAHKLKVFAAVKGDHISGYAFFIGGGRAQNVNWIAKDAKGNLLARGTTDEQGRYDFAPGEPVASEITITVDTKEGHIASAALPASRFGDSPGTLSTAQTPDLAKTPPHAVGTAISPDRIEEITPIIEQAVQNQVTPLLERIEQMDARMRYTDMLSAIFLIFGLAGLALWVRGRR